MRKGYCPFSLSLILVAGLLYGCSFTSLILHPFGTSKSSLKKRVLVTAIVDQANFGKQTTKQLRDMLLTGLSATGKVVIFDYQEAISTANASAGLSYGVLTDKTLLEMARTQGINAVLSCILSPIEREQKIVGIWPLHKAIAYYQIALVSNLIDPQSGTVILSHLESDGIRIDLEEEEFTDRQWVRQQMKQRVLPKLIRQSIKPIKKALESEPWEGRILSVDHRIQINAGHDVGVRPEYRFDVYGGNEKVRAKDGLELLISWQKVGTIRVTEVGSNTSFAIPIDGKDFKAGQRIVSID